MHLQKAWWGNTGSPLADSPPPLTHMGIPVSDNPKNSFLSGFLAIFEQKVDFFDIFEKFRLNVFWTSKTHCNAPKTHFLWLETHFRPLTSIWSRNHKIEKIHFFTHFLAVFCLRNFDETFQIWTWKWKSEGKNVVSKFGKAKPNPKQHSCLIGSAQTS